MDGALTLRPATGPLTATRLVGMPARTRREDLVALLQDYAGESELLGQEFAGRHGLHPRTSTRCSR